MSQAQTAPTPMASACVLKEAKGKKVSKRVSSHSPSPSRSPEKRKKIENRKRTVLQTAPRFPRSNSPSTIGRTVKHRARATSRMRRRRSSETKGETAEMTARAERKSGGGGGDEGSPPAPPPCPPTSLPPPSNAKVPVRGKRVGEAEISCALFLCARSVCVASSEPRRARLGCCCCCCFCCSRWCCRGGKR